MKRLLLASLALCCSLTAFTQSTHRYHFDHGLNEVFSLGPVLTTTTDCTGNRVPESLPINITKNVYQFKKDCGLVFHDAADFLMAGSYTIELYVKLDTIQGYKKLVDMDSLSKDKGLYQRNGKVALYSVFESTDSVFASGTYNYVAISRNATSKAMIIHCNGKTLGTHNDATDQYVYDMNKRLIFFQDDNGTNGEESGGSVAMIHISNFAMDSNAIKTKFTQIGTNLSVGNAQAGAKNTSIYPNPATDHVQVVTVADCNYSICNVEGKVLRIGHLTKGDNKLIIEDLSAGIYLLYMIADDGQASSVAKIVKQ